MAREGYFIEFASIGHQVKVVAIDPITGIEVSIVAPDTATQAEMTRVAVAKLERRILQEAQPKHDEKPQPSDNRPGKLV